MLASLLKKRRTRVTLTRTSEVLDTIYYRAVVNGKSIMVKVFLNQRLFVFGMVFPYICKFLANRFLLTNP
jgi:hypothetical protein